MKPPAPPPPVSKPYFFYGHRKPSQNRPTVRGGLFSNRQTLNPKKLGRPSEEPFDLQKWDPDHKENQIPLHVKDPSERFFILAKNLSPITRYIVDAFRNHKYWTPELVADLKLVTFFMAIRKMFCGILIRFSIECNELCGINIRVMHKIKNSQVMSLCHSHLTVCVYC